MLTIEPVFVIWIGIVSLPFQLQPTKINQNSVKAASLSGWGGSHYVF